MKSPIFITSKNLKTAQTDWNITYEANKFFDQTFLHFPTSLTVFNS